MQRSDLTCFCRKCPTYKGAGGAGWNFCALGKSTSITEEKGCICGKCPMTVQTGEDHLYCCTRGTKTHDMFDELMKGLRS